MIPIINMSDSYTIFIAVVLFVLVLFLSKETKKSSIIGLMLGAFLFIVSIHSIEFFAIKDAEIITNVVKSITVDLIFVFISFFSYLWIDDIESKDKKIKSVNNSLDWFWKKV